MPSMSITSTEFHPSFTSQSTIQQQHTVFESMDQHQHHHHSVMEETKSFSESSIQQSSQNFETEMKPSGTLPLESYTRFYRIRPYPYQVEIFSRIR
jgi:hypothetical protein